MKVLLQKMNLINKKKNFLEINPSGFVNNMNALFFFRNAINGIAEFKEERR
jgi:hypothetical protein